MHPFFFLIRAHQPLTTDCKDMYSSNIFQQHELAKCHRRCRGEAGGCVGDAGGCVGEAGGVDVVVLCVQAGKYWF